MSENNDSGGHAVAQILYEAFMSRYGSSVGAVICLGIIGLAVFFAGMSSLTSNSR